MAQQLTGEILPISNASGAVQYESVPTGNVYLQARAARSDARQIGIRARRAIIKAEEAAMTKSKKKKKGRK